MRSRIKTTVTLTFALVALLLVALTWDVAASQTVIKLVPREEQIRVSKETTVDLTVEQVTELYGAQIMIRFDPAVLEVVDADPAKEGIQVQPGTLPSPDFIVQNMADNQAGTIDYALTSLPPSKPSSGDGVIARITFRAKKAAVSPLILEQALLADTAGGSIEATSQHGQIKVTSGSVLLLAIGGGLAALLVIGGGIGYVVTRK